MAHLVQNLVTREFASATHGVSFSAKGYHGNNHFCTIDDACADFDRQVAETETSYTSCKSTQNYRKTEIPAIRGIVREIIFVNIKKDGTPGKIKNTIRLYLINS